MADSSFVDASGVEQLAIEIKQYIADELKAVVLSVNGETPDANGNVALTKSDIGLGNVANVGTITSVSQNSTMNVTSGAVYNFVTSKIEEAITTALNTAV